MDFLHCLAKEATLKPGPGHYPVYPGISKSGIYFLSKFRSSLCRTFGARCSDTSLSHKTQTPGPGTYRVPSDFGYAEPPGKLVPGLWSEEGRKSGSVTALRRSKDSRESNPHSLRGRIANSTTKSAQPSAQLQHNASEIVLSRDQPNEPHTTNFP